MTLLSVAADASAESFHRSGPTSWTPANNRSNVQTPGLFSSSPESSIRDHVGRPSALSVFLLKLVRCINGLPRYRRQPPVRLPQKCYLRVHLSRCTGNHAPTDPQSTAPDQHAQGPFTNPGLQNDSFTPAGHASVRAKFVMVFPIGLLIRDVVARRPELR